MIKQMNYPDDYVDKVICGDCLEIMQNIPNKFIDCIITDPFYVPPNMFKWKNFDDFYWNFNQRWLTEVKRIIKTDFHLFISFSSQDMARFEFLLRELGFEIKSRLVWHYRNAGGRCRSSDCFGKTYDFIFHCSSGKKLYFPAKWDDRRFDVITMAIPQSNFKEGKFHRFQKPLKLIERLIEFGSCQGDVVLDPFLGSGTTAVAAKKFKRHFIGIEISEEYCEISRKRLAEVDMDLFTQVAAK